MNADHMERAICFQFMQFILIIIYVMILVYRIYKYAFVRLYLNTYMYFTCNVKSLFCITLILPNGVVARQRLILPN